MKKENFTKYFIKKRKLLGYSQNKIANEIGISVQAVSNWERGVAFPDLSYLDDIAKLLDTNVESLISGKDKKIKIKDDIHFNSERFSLALSKLRKSKNLTQNDLGKILGISGQNISKFENGVFLPSIEILKKYSKLFDISFLSLYYGIDDKDLYETKETKKQSNKQKWMLILPFTVCIIISLSLVIYLINSEKQPSNDEIISNDKREYKVIIDGVEKSYYYGDIISLEDVEDTENEVFEGYFDELGNQYSGDIEITNDLIINLKFSKKYKIMLDLDEGECESSVIDVVYSHSVELPRPNKDEYIFIGWYINDVIYKSGFVYNFEENITLKARYISVNSAFLYEITEEGAILKSYLLNDDVVTIPDTIEGKTVIEVKNTLLEGKTNIKEVVFPASIITFEDGILAGQNDLEKITIATDANTTIKKLFNVSSSSELPESFDTVAFNKVTENNKRIFAGNQNTYNIILPSNLDYITEGYFKECTYIKTIDIGDNVVIFPYQFADCTNLTSIKVSNSLKCICECAFYNCTNLQSIEIPDSVVQIQSDAFLGCVNLQSVILSKNITSIENGTFASCKSLKTIEIPEGVTYIGEYAFERCSSLNNVTIPEKVTYIGKQAFCSCSSLTSINIPEEINEISDGVFFGCTSLTSITIPNSVTCIGEDAFRLCTDLTSVTIPESVTTISQDAFFYCTNLANIYYDGIIDFWNEIEKLIDWDTNTGSYVVHCSDGKIYK